MKYAIVLSSLTGNTNMLASAIYNKLGDKDCLYFGKPCQDALKADIIYVGFWTDMGTANKEISGFLKTINNKKVFLFGTCGFGLSQAYFDKILDSTLANLNATNELVGRFVCVGKMQMKVKERYLKLKQETKEYEKFDSLIKNFDEALSHPNEKDINNLLKLID